VRPVSSYHETVYNYSGGMQFTLLTTTDHQLQ
jgi:hypothetical protein